MLRAPPPSRARALTRLRPPTPPHLHTAHCTHTPLLPRTHTHTHTPPHTHTLRPHTTTLPHTPPHHTPPAHPTHHTHPALPTLPSPHYGAIRWAFWTAVGSPVHYLRHYYYSSPTSRLTPDGPLYATNTACDVLLDHRSPFGIANVYRSPFHNANICAHTPCRHSNTGVYVRALSM